MNRRFLQEAAFTLIELLVVITIFADGETTYFRFPTEMYNWNYGSSPKPDPNYTWW